MTDHSMSVAGIDTGKAELHVHLLPSGERFAVANTLAGIKTLVERCRKACVARAAIEATSIYHRAAARALAAAGIDTAVVQPRQSRAFAKAVLQWTKSDKADAEVLARFAQAIDAARPLPSSRIEALGEALLFIEQLEQRHAWLKTSRERFKDPGPLKAIDADIKRLGKQRAARLKALEKDVRKDEELAKRLDLLLTIPSVGLRTALCLVIRMPELGTISREKIVRLAGLAPVLNESGSFKGERHIYGGRAKVRKSLYMAAFIGAMQWNPELKTLYQRLAARGQPHTKAIIACARKLLIFANTVLERKTPWTTKEVTP